MEQVSERKNKGGAALAVITLATLACVLGGCAPASPYAGGVPAMELDVQARGPVSGTGIESRDIAAMADVMMRDLLANPALAGRSVAPRVIIDDAYFRNEGSQPINRKLIINKLRVGLARAAQGRMRFVGREFADAVAQERALKREGVTDVGTTGLTKAQAGADFRLTGTLATLDAHSSTTGLDQRYTQITFEMIDLESGELVWSNAYEINRAAADDIIYR